MKIPTVTGNLLDHLRDEILTGRLISGEKINEIKLANELEISRSPIREVLRILENERLVENIPRKGTFVSKISFRDFYETYLIREMIEIKAIEIFKLSLNCKELIDEVKTFSGLARFLPTFLWQRFQGIIKLTSGMRPTPHQGGLGYIFIAGIPIYLEVAPEAIEKFFHVMCWRLMRQQCRF